MTGILILTSLLLVASSVSSTLGDDGGDSGVLEVWPVVRPDLKYRKLYQFQMNDDQKKRLMIEEWGSVEEQLYRMDLISEQQRVSYLSNGKTGEVWRYKPFTCDQLESSSQELSILSNLFRGSSLSSSIDQQSASNIVYGLGPLWLRARADKSKMRECKSSRLKRTDGLICWETSMGSPDRPDYLLRFYFRSQKLEDLAAVIWAQEGIRGGNSVVARVKLVFMDTNHLDPTALQLPMGYGCRRLSETIDPQLSLKLLEPGTTQQALLEVVLSRNLGDSHATNDKWASRRHTLRLVRGTFDMSDPNRAYYVAIEQSRAAGFDLRRRKRVWSAKNWSANEAAKEAQVYTLDEVSGECKAEPMSLNDIIRMSFPNGPFKVAEEDLEGEISASIGLEFIHWLFEDVEDYHLIREQSEQLGEVGLLSISLYEKRIKQIRLNDGLWTGPVTIVKKTAHLSVKNQMEEMDTQPLHISLSVFFYTDDLTRILDKLVINLLENDLVDVNYMHKLMDVDACFSGIKSESVVVKYPLESQKVVEAIERIREPVQELLVSNLFQMTPIEPLQVSNVELSFDHFYMYFKFHLADLPLTGTFDFQSGLELTLSKDADGKKESFMEKISASLEKCAASCAHYNCLRFSYNSNSLVCRLELAEASADFQQSPNGHLYTAPGPRLPESSAWNKLLGSSLANKPHLKPSILLKALKELTNLEISVWDSLPLVVRMRKSSLLETDAPEEGSREDDVLLLKPISVHSEYDSIGEIADAPMARESELQIEYSVLMENREFKRNKAFERLSDEVTYESCAQACEANDCRSFSYCEARQTCSLTNWHSSKDIEAATDKRQACRVFVVDYLSKFDDFGPVWATVRVARVVSDGERAADCATACMEETHFACQGFYHCKDKTCLLQNQHALEEDSTDRLMLAIGEPEAQQKQKCRLFSRSYLSQFNDYYGKALKEVVGQPKQLGVGAEQCAEKCIRQSCLAFHVCLEPRTGQPACQISSGKELRRDQVESRDHCTTFVLSDKSQYNLFKKRTNFREPDKQSAIETSSGIAADLIVVDKDQVEAIENDINKDLLPGDPSGLQDESKLQQSSNWFDKLVSFFYGSLLGVCLGLAWKKHDFIYLFTTRTFSRLNGH